MSSSSARTRLGARLPVLAAFVFLVPAVLTTALYLFNLDRTPVRNAATQVQTIARSKASEVETWFNERLSGARMVLETPLLRTGIESFLASPASSIRGARGSLTGFDYRGEPALAAGIPIAGTPWFLLAKLDQAEVRGSLLARAWTPLIFLVLVGVLIVLLGRVLWHKQRTELMRQNLLPAQRLQSLTQHARDVILLLDEQWRIIEANDRAVETYGYPKEKLLKLRLQDLQPAEERAAFEESLREFTAPAGGCVESVQRRQDDTRFPVEISGGAFVFGDRRYFQCIIRDITERKRREKELLRRNRLYNLLSRVNQAVLRVTSREELFRQVCESAVEQGGFKLAWIGCPQSNGETVDAISWAGSDAVREEVSQDGAMLCNLRGFAGRHNQVTVHNTCVPEQSESPCCRTLRRIGLKACASFQIQFQGRPWGWFSVSAREPRFFQDEEVALLREVALAVSFAIDHLEKTEQHHQAQRALQESESKYRSLFEHAPDALFLTHRGVWIDCNPAAEDLFGCPRDQLIGRGPADFSPPQQPDGTDSSAKISELVARAEAGVVQAFEWAWQRPDGSAFDAEVMRSVYRAGRDLISTTMVRDITERKEAEEALRNSEEKLRAFFDSAVIGTLSWDNEGRLLKANPELLRIVALTSGQFESRELKLKDLTPPEFHAIDEDRHEEARRRGACTPYEKQLFRPDGSRVWVLVGYVLVGRNRETALGFILDLTERKQLQAQLLRTQRLESLGTLAGGVAHDLNNILAPILMAAEVLSLNRSRPSDEKMLATIKDSAQRGAAVVKQLLTFARGADGKKVTLQVGTFASEMVRIARETFPKSIVIKSSTAEGLWPIQADPTHLHQVLLNLFVNARDAMPEGGVLSLNVQNMRFSEADPAVPHNAKAGPYLLLEVSDSGTGIPPEIIDRIWDPFFTTKEVGHGTGLGLSTIMGIVKAHDGFVSVSSEPGIGATFKVFLPASPGAQTEADTFLLSEIPRGNGEWILVADDEETIRDVTRETLTHHGYQVETAANGTDALVAFIQAEGKFKLVLTDIMMPLMDGLALARAVRRIEPEVKILCSSGLEKDGRAAELRRMGVTQILPKPYPRETLLRAVHRELGPVTEASSALMSLAY